mmetsp:Transcript_58257/g.126520  ORF Transcript_58257/g.126520 Transcript_58257/m.126520 type:complete len:436 (-) Transcript_58257:514-1821(-)
MNTALPQAVATEHVIRLLHAMDLDLDEIIVLDDLRTFVARNKLAFEDDELVGMFKEANYKADGRIDQEQLGKAVSGKHPHRRYNESWFRLFESAPRSFDARRITALPAEVIRREPIQASYEQAEQLVTFSPMNYSSSGKLNGSLSRSTGLGSRTLSFSCNDLPPTPHRFDASGTQHFDEPPVRFGFEQQADFAAECDALRRASNAVDWKATLKTAGAPQVAEPTPQEWRHYASAARIPLRQDGVCCRTGAFTAPLRWLATEGDGTPCARGNVAANSKAARVPSTDSQAKAFKPFAVTTIQDEKLRWAQQSVLEKGEFSEESVGAVSCGMPRHSGAPASHSFRPKFSPPEDQPPFVSHIGTHWPKKEGRPVSGLYEIAPASGAYASGGYASGHFANGAYHGQPSARLGATENLQPGSRLHWLATNGGEHHPRPGAF